MTQRNCPQCHGTGYVVEERDGIPLARPCKCRIADHSMRLWSEAGIPQRYHHHCVFDNYRPEHPSQEEALMLAKQYGEDYPAFPPGAANGLLFMGPCGRGKTHLAIAILQVVLVRKGMPAVFVDLNNLYRQIRGTYGKISAEETEYDILTPLVEADLLLIDDLGCLNSPWSQDTLHYLVSQRYNEQRPTLCTTNYLDDPLAREPSLENRIGTRTRSRLKEMCRTVLVEGPDHRDRARAGRAEN